jgi:hypothetical protein
MKMNTVLKERLWFVLSWGFWLGLPVALGIGALICMDWGEAARRLQDFAVYGFFHLMNQLAGR